MIFLNPDTVIQSFLLLDILNLRTSFPVTHILTQIILF